MTQIAIKPDPDIKQIITDFQDRSGLRDVEYELKQRSDGQALILQIANPTERFYKILISVAEAKASERLPTPTIKKRTPANRLQSPEAKYFLRTLSEALNINRSSFKEGFFERYTKSVSNAEAQITAAANHIVYGRRGAGKSILLLYAMRSREMEGLPSAWIDMQTYEKRKDSRVAIEILSAVMDELGLSLSISPNYSSMRNRMGRLKDDPDLSDDKIREFLPEVRQVLGAASGNVFIFLDDFHLIDDTLQPKLLAFLYAVARGYIRLTYHGARCRNGQ